jgi:hypothetical protein
LTLRGYHSLDGDQSYRLPLLVHQIDPSVYADDPFVRAFDLFNPHRGSLMVLGAATRLFGLSPALFLFFVLTFLATCRGVDDLARATWPDRAPHVGWAAITLVMLAKAGNIGTNHLFEAMVLDRLMTLALGWLALAALVSSPGRNWLRTAGLCAPAAVIHPSLGLQLALLVMGSWVVWAALGGRAEVTAGLAARGCIATALAVVPGLALNLAHGQILTEGLAANDFWNLAVELQGPQHMLPHLWRLPQWLAWGCYFVLAATALGGNLQRGCSGQDDNRSDRPQWPVARVRLIVMLAVVLAWLAASWCAIEIVHHLRITLFQPFRMATVARGLALVLIAGRIIELFRRSDWLARLRAILIVVAFAGDWMLVIVTVAEVLSSAVESIASRHAHSARERGTLGKANPSLARPPLVADLSGATLASSQACRRRLALPLARHAHAAYFVAIAWGLYFLGRHDTESGHWPILLALTGGSVSCLIEPWAWPRLQSLTILRSQEPASRILACLLLSWLVPALSLLAGMIPAEHSLSRVPLVQGLVGRSRFTMVPVDDIERLAVWCRENTPSRARFIGPPGPKTFRLWSRRSLAFCRAGSPYDAAALADWFARFQDHVNVHLPAAAFVKSYVAARHETEARYDGLSKQQKAALALRQGADHVIAVVAAPAGSTEDREAATASPLQLLHREGRYAVYRVCSELLSQDQRQR